MNKKLLAFLLMFPCTIFGAAFQLYELGSPSIGTAGVGQAVLNDASTSYFNPAAMTQLDTSQMMLGSQALIGQARFQPNNNNTFSGTNGGNAGTIVPGLDIYDVLSYSPNLKLGINVTSPYGGLLSYTDGWVGRYFVQDTQLLALDVNPSAAYCINDWLSVGGGATIEYAQLDQTNALFIPLSDTDHVDGQINVKLHDYSPGFNFGILLTPSDTTRIGLTYRSTIRHSLNGDLTFLRLTETPNAIARVVMPQNIIGSISQDFSDKFTLLAEAGWANWSEFQNTTLTVDNFTLTTPRNWSDTYRLGLGGRYHVSPCLLFQAGVSYDSSPTNTADRLPDLPMDRQIRVGTGAIYTTRNRTQLGMQYEYINLGNAAINHVTRLGTLGGSYSSNYAHVLALSANFDL